MSTGSDIASYRKAKSTELASWNPLYAEYSLFYYAFRRLSKWAMKIWQRLSFWLSLSLSWELVAGIRILFGHCH